ncbi:MAG: sodium:panthothenate symporter, partial [Kiritimatiellae bacterium]|nr:sodium:panthothenate symporter [Kiritimatiellia bacterium]
TTNSARTPHEQKMAGILGTWRNGFAFTMVGLTTLLVITVMNHKAFVLPGAHGKFSSHETRKALLNKVAAEAVPDAAVRGRIADALDALPPRLLDEPLSQLKNNDTIYIDTARDMINGNIPDALRAEAAAVAAGERAPSPELAAIQGANALQAQKVRTLYGQMMLPATLRQILPTGVIGLFALLMIMLLVSTDDSRIFNASSTWAQDVILPFMKKPPTSRQHIALLRWSSVAVAVFFFVVAVFFSQLDYINMFTQIMCAIWLGGGGTVMVFGLYSRFGNIVGAWCSIFFGCGFSLAGLILQRIWSASVVPVLARHGWTEGVFRFFAKVAEPLNPYVDWSFGFNSGESTLEQAIQLFREKFFMNSTEIYGISMVLSLIAYCLGSWIALKAGWCKPFNLDKLLHRGEYADEAEKERMAKAASVKVSLLERIVGIDGEYTRGDRIIAWSVFIYSIGYGFGVVFLGVLFWNFVSPWPKPWWGTYYYITSLIVPIIVGCVSTVWFMWGGIRDGIRLFKDLDARVADASDNGFVDRKS